MRLDVVQNETFSTREAVAIISGAARSLADFDNVRLKEWYRRGGLLPEQEPGKGRERTYRFNEILFLAAFAMLSRYTDSLCTAAIAAHEFCRAMKGVHLAVFYPDDGTILAISAQAIESTANQGAVVISPSALASQLCDRAADAVACRIKKCA